MGGRVFLEALHPPNSPGGGPYGPAIGYYENVKIIGLDKDGGMGRKGQLDGVDFDRGMIYEDKSGVQTRPEDYEKWAAKNVYTKLDNKIRDVMNGSDTIVDVEPGSSPAVPCIESVQSIKKYEVWVKNASPEMQYEVNHQIELLNKKWGKRGYEITVQYGERPRPEPN